MNDLDVVVYVRADDAPEMGLVSWMAQRLRDAYGKTISPDQIEEGAHCPTITFASGLSVDVVPVLYEGDDNDVGFLIAKDTGDRLKTSVTQHLTFVRTRKNVTPDHFTQMVRFVKWWVRTQKKLDSEFKFKSFMAELIVAKLVDEGVDMADYPEALARVFSRNCRFGPKRTDRIHRLLPGIGSARSHRSCHRDLRSWSTRTTTSRSGTPTPTGFGS